MAQKQLRFGKGFRVARKNPRAQAATMVLVPVIPCPGGTEQEGYRLAPRLSQTVRCRRAGRGRWATGQRVNHPDGDDQHQCQDPDSFEAALRSGLCHLDLHCKRLRPALKNSWIGTFRGVS